MEKNSLDQGAVKHHQTHDPLEEILENREEHKKISRCALIVFFIYGPLFCFTSIVALLSFIIFDSGISPFFTWLTISSCFALPTAIGYTIIKVCCGNWKGKYKKCVAWAWFPIAFILGTYICERLISWLIGHEIALILH